MNMNTTSFDLIATVSVWDAVWGIGHNGQIPWKNTAAWREDQRFFNTLTSESGKTCLIMGRKTWEILGPQPGRVSVVISSAHDYPTIFGWLTPSPVVWVKSFDAALQWAMSSDCARTFVCGGKSVFTQAFRSPYLRYLYINVINDPEYTCDTTIPAISDINTAVAIHKTYWLTYYVYENVNKEELKYHQLCKKLLIAPIKPNRTGINAHARFHEVLKFRLSNDGYDGEYERIMPLITSKFTSFRAVYHELIWFLRACGYKKSSDSTVTDNTSILPSTKYLEENDVRIWRGNTTSEFLQKRGLDLQEGQTGPIYGVQWRAWQGRSEGGEFDQIESVIQRLKEDPFDRRLIVSAWNVADLDSMALVPCHYCFQFVVTVKGNEKLLNCIVNMRSADVGLGVPFNIASYALLTHMVSAIVGIRPGKLSVSMADCHLYKNHDNGIQKMLTRRPKQFPRIKFSERIEKTGDHVTIDNFAYDFTISDYIIDGYVSAPAIKLDMAV